MNDGIELKYQYKKVEVNAYGLQCCRSGYY